MKKIHKKSNKNKCYLWVKNRALANRLTVIAQQQQQNKIFELDYNRHNDIESFQFFSISPLQQQKKHQNKT